MLRCRGADRLCPATDSLRPGDPLLSGLGVPCLSDSRVPASAGGQAFDKEGPWWAGGPCFWPTGGACPGPADEVRMSGGQRGRGPGRGAEGALLWRSSSSSMASGLARSAFLRAACRKPSEVLFTLSPSFPGRKSPEGPS